MFKVLIIKEAIAGTLEHQTQIKQRALSELEKQLNALDIESVQGIFPSENDGEFQVIAVVKVAPRKSKKEDK